MTVDVKKFREEIGELYRPCLFEVDVDGFPNLKFRIEGVSYNYEEVYNYDLGDGKYKLNPNNTMELTITEDESFSVRKALNNFTGRNLTLRTFTKTGEVIYEETKVITRTNYSAGFSWKNTLAPLYWNVKINVNDEIKGDE